MNRRNFFSAIAGAIGGVLAVFMPGSKRVQASEIIRRKYTLTRKMYANAINDMEKDEEKHSGHNEYVWHKHKDGTFHCKRYGHIPAPQMPELKVLDGYPKK